MNIFLGVYACEPNNGSEPEVGWQMVNQIAKKLPESNIYAITKKNNKEAIESEGYTKNIKFFYYEPPKWLTFWKKGGRGVRTYYYIWSIGAALFMKKQKIKFDIIHHITFVNDWLPTFYYLLKNKDNKFIWGPIGSHDPIRTKFLDTSKKRVIEKIRIFLQLFYRNFDPSFYLAKRKADCIIGINGNVKNKMYLRENKNFIAEPAIGIEKSIVLNNISNNITDTFTVISVGRLIYFKNFKLTIYSFAKFLETNPNIQNVELLIIGDGKERKEYEKLVNDLNIGNYVKFTGNISLGDVQLNFEKADLFLFPTLENAGFVTLEAMSKALPVLALKYGGPEQFILNNRDKQLVNESLSYDDLVNEFANKIEYFYNHRDEAIEIGKINKQDILENFTWEAKAEKMIKLYKELLDEKN